MPARLDGPPPSPPPVTGAMGMSGVTQRFGESLRGNPPDLQQAGANNPQGMLKTQYDAVEKVVQQMAAMSKTFAPFAMRALATLREGVSTAMSQPPDAAGSGQGQQGAESVQSPAVGTAANSAGAGFVG